METVDLDDLEDAIGPSSVKRRLTKPLGTSALSINYYELERDESFAFAYHAHEYQEEIFIILAGMATFETEDGAVEVGEGETIRFAPGEFQRGWNRGDELVRAYAIGAPRKYGDAEPRFRECPTCETTTNNDLDYREQEGVGSIVAICRECETVTGRWSGRSRE